ncbi:MAG: prephenate dehydrogenase/arogenate dehydrogenase family protein [Pseudomonadota bacterium]
MSLIHPRVGIVGGRGRMGLWFARLLEGQGFEVLCAGRKTALRPLETARLCDVVVVSVPIHMTEEIIREIGPVVREEGLLMDLTSLKKAPVEAMLKYSRAEVLGVHPLFGPCEKTNQGLKVVLCPARGAEGPAWAKGVFQKEGLETILMEPETHDVSMGLIQGLSHFSTLSLALAIMRSGLPLDEMLRLATPSFEQKIDRIREMTGQPAELFCSLLMENPGAGGFLSEYLASAGDLEGVIREGDKEAFTRFFETIKHFFRWERGAEGRRETLPIIEEDLENRASAHDGP